MSFNNPFIDLILCKLINDKRNKMKNPNTIIDRSFEDLGIKFNLLHAQSIIEYDATLVTYFSRYFQLFFSALAFL